MAATTETTRPSAVDPGHRSGGGLLKWLSRTWPSALVLVGIIVLWELVVEVFGVSDFVIAKPSEIAAETWDSRELLLTATWVTTQEIVYGFLISVAVGILLAVLLARFGRLHRAVYPLIVLFQVVPKVALAPIFILWFGYELTPKLLLVVVISFFPITLNMLVGLRSIDQDLLLLMRSVGATRNQILTRIQIPTSLPYLFAGMRIAITLSVIGAVVAEFAGASDGLGYLIQFASTQLDTPLMFSALILVSLLGLALYYGMSLIEFVLARKFPHIATDDQ
ncbi:NitT/TauT family transport system permease protein [Spinactinospora alkalitolerans]|uniref:NitT/TauT family transport system permease protein n=1 Tax=Spinactinospora alkalitolerans TaxID=687207 RepID=A0A852TTJ0_9ACTN|nr:ABC transporter permease [Spinactinospora alkalitolerans]NYE45434.1 NitT/TauT family transport system permease protein [Spinactinospora alkalitolerans]